MLGVVKIYFTSICKMFQCHRRSGTYDPFFQLSPPIGCFFFTITMSVIIRGILELKDIDSRYCLSLFINENLLGCYSYKFYCRLPFSPLSSPNAGSRFP